MDKPEIKQEHIDYWRDKIPNLAKAMDTVRKMTLDEWYKIYFQTLEQDSTHPELMVIAECHPDKKISDHAKRVLKDKFEIE